MAQTLIHPQRVAFDAARIFVRAAAEPTWAGWLADQLAMLAGPAYRQHVIDTRALLLTSSRPDMPDAQAGLWRVRLAELLHTRPELTEELLSLHRRTAQVLHSWSNSG